MGCPGRKSRLESFAGADKTLTIEAMMGDRRALQVTHCMGAEAGAHAGPCGLAMAGFSHILAAINLPFQEGIHAYE